MEVQLTPDQEAFVRQAIDSGRLPHAEEAVQQALSLWESRERSRVEILCALDEAESDLAVGNFSDYSEESLPRLAQELKREARASLSSGPKGWLKMRASLRPLARNHATRMGQSPPHLRAPT